MIADIYRPWGQLQWLMEKLPRRNWSFLGTLAIEDRCTAAFAELTPYISKKTFLKIADPHISKPDFEEQSRNTLRELTKAGLRHEEIVEADLMLNFDLIDRKTKPFIHGATDKVILDISSMPKRWFFPIMRFLLNEKRIRTLVVSYSIPDEYGEHLSSDPEPLGPLPTFDSTRTNSSLDDLIVGVGFAPLGLKALFDREIRKIRYLCPFPPGPTHYSRNWEFLRDLDDEVKNRNLSVDDRWFINTYDLPEAFDALCRATNNGSRTCALAPFGPKTHSLAMCLFALSVQKAGKETVPVYYTQPNWYAPDYSKGIALENNNPDIKAYCIKLNGRLLYEINNGSAE